VTHCVDTAVNAVQPADSNPVPNAVLVKTRSAQLLDRGDTMLPGSDGCDRGIGVGALVVHIATKSPGTADSPPARPELCATTGRERYLGRAASRARQTATPDKTRIVPPKDSLRFQLAAYECRQGSDDRFAETGGRSTDGRTCRI